MGTRRQFLGQLGAIAAVPAIVPSEELFPSETIQGIYLPGWKAVGTERLSRAERLLGRLGLNTLMVDLKDADGAVFFEADNEIGRRLQAKTAHGRPRTLNFTRLRALQQNGIRLLGRHVMFRDRGLYMSSEQLRLYNKGNEYWVDPRLPDSLDYNLALLDQSKKFGFDEIVLDYIRFPAVNDFGTLGQKCRRIDAVVAEVREHVSNLGVQVFGWAAWHHEKAGVGQRIPTLDPHIDHVYPMVYPSHFQKGSFGFDDPNEHPSYILRAGYKAAIKKVSGAEKVVPMVQSFWHRPDQVRAQLDAVAEEEMQGYVAWNARGNYDLLERALAI